jgi:hypothetical protein
MLFLTTSALRFGLCGMDGMPGASLSYFLPVPPANGKTSASRLPKRDLQDAASDDPNIQRFLAAIEKVAT